ncbi:hypothetical protein TNCT_111711 [Trichonephila clavata]|uniref:Uncharacterized protein n=1 Tax=Trichonephila clavata TaxID=2740835 RepID=A0A8X6H6G2_TRICU|nr:hypothetical protein TNCT_395451 [Trichonephila clavata]GFR17882.1 hypothetical protein TNCT_111711 [Trichonephila clavata]
MLGIAFCTKISSSPWCDFRILIRVTENLKYSFIFEISVAMRPKKHPYRNSRSKSQRLRRAKKIIRNLLPKTQIAETQLLGVPGSCSRNDEFIEK